MHTYSLKLFTRNYDGSSRLHALTGWPWKGYSLPFLWTVTGSLGIVKQARCLKINLIGVKTECAGCFYVAGEIYGKNNRGDSVGLWIVEGLEESRDALAVNSFIAGFCPCNSWRLCD
jgi:hypothetical protein